MRLSSLLLVGSLAALASGCPAETKTKTKTRRSSKKRAPEWPGTFTSAALTIAIQAGAEDDQVKGTITLGAKQFPFTGTTNGDDLEGSFKAGETAFAFTAGLDGDELSLTTGKGESEKTYELKREAAPNPLADGATKTAAEPPNPLTGGNGWGEPEPAKTAPQPPTVTPPAPVTAKPPAHQPPPPQPPVSAPIDWAPFSKNGFTMRYPRSWTAKPIGADAVQLIPADVATTSQGTQAEFYLVKGAPNQGAKRADEPRAIAFFQQQMTQAFPAMRQSKEPRTLPQGAIELTYVGKNPQTQQHVTTRLRVVVIDSVALMFFAMAETPLLEKRDAVLAQVFGSFGWKAPPNDRRLIGSWRNTRTYMSGSFSSVTDRYLFLRADGRCFGGGRMAAGMGHKDAYGNPSGSSGVDTGKTKGWEYNGRWIATNRTLTLNWSNGKREYYGYYICDGTSLLLRSSPKQKKGGLLFKRTR